MEPLIFKTTRDEVPVEIDGVKYVLREASGEASRRFRNAVFEATKMVDGKVSGIGNLADSEALLVSLCLYVTVKPGSPSLGPVSLDTVRKWPDSIVSALFDKIKAISPTLQDKKETKETLVEKMAKLQERLDNWVEEPDPKK